jgi:hypothetical protein
MKISLLFILTAFLIFTSCETDFDVNAGWKETTVVYGLLDQSLDTQSVVIYKAFLGNQSAYIFAQEADSIYYGEYDLEVMLYGISDNDTIQTIELEYVLTDNRKNGGLDTIFSTEYSVEYITTQDLNADLVYHLMIRNLNTDNVVRSNTELISELDINPSFGDVNFFKNDEYRNYTLRWESSANARIYKPYLRFYYIEKEQSTGIVTYNYIEQSFSERQSQSTNGGESMKLELGGESFYYFVKNSIEENTSVTRINAEELNDGLPESNSWVGGIEFRFVVGGETISQYVSINNLPGLLFQDPPNFTNIENGIGIFSSRLNGKLEGVKLGDQSLFELANGEITKNLGFITP